MSATERRSSQDSRRSKRTSTNSSRRSSSSSATEEPAHRVRFHSSKSLVTVKRLPCKEADFALESRKGTWEPAPEDDFFWDGEERCFREHELSTDELAEVLKSRRKKRGMSLGRLFGRPNYKARARKMLAEEGSYQDPYAYLDEQEANKLARIDEGANEYTDEPTDHSHGEESENSDDDSDVLFAERSLPAMDLMPPRSSIRHPRPLKPKRRASKRSSKQATRRHSNSTGSDLPQPAEPTLSRARGLSTHRDSMFNIRRRQFLRDLTEQEIMAILVSMIGMICFLIGVLLGALTGSFKKPLLSVLILFIPLAGAVPFLLQRIPQEMKSRLRRTLVDWVVPVPID